MIGPVNVDFAEHREGDAIGQRTKGFDIRFCARFLSPELIAGETQDDQAIVLVFLIQVFEALILARETAFGGDIDD